MRLRSASTTSSNASETVKPKSSQVSLGDLFAQGTVHEKKSNGRTRLQSQKQTTTVSRTLIPSPHKTHEHHLPVNLILL